MQQHEHQQTPQAFMSYAYHDDKHDGGYLSKLRQELSDEIQALSGKSFPIEDANNIPWGQIIDKHIAQTLDTATLFIPIVTPSYLNDSTCREQLQHFAARKRPILPIYYIQCPEMEAHNPSDEIAQILKRYQYVDWRKLRRVSFDDDRVHEALQNMVEKIVQAMGLQPPSGSSQGEISQTPQKKVSIHLPYEVDRTDQKNQLIQKFATYQEQRPSYPFICVVHGDTDQCYDKFLEFIEIGFLPNVLKLREGEKHKQYSMACPTTLSSDVSDNLLGKLHTEVWTWSPRVKRSQYDINEHFKNNPAVLITMHITPDKKHDGDIIAKCVEFWEQWEIEPGKPLFVFLFIHYDIPTRWFMRFSRHPSLKKTIVDVVSTLSARCVVLPELGNVKKNDVTTWADSRQEEIQTYTKRADWDKKIKELFQPYNAHTKGLPLQVVGECLNQLLQGLECQT